MASSAGLRILAGRYARALAEASPKDLSAAQAALEGWLETVRHSPELIRVLSNPRIPRPGRISIAREIFANLSAPPVLQNLAALLIEKNRFSLLPAIHAAVRDERETRDGICRAVIESPREVPEAVRERIRSRLAEIFRRHVQIESRVRPNILGGVNLRIGSRVWYGSVLHRLEQVLQ